MSYRDLRNFIEAMRVLGYPKQVSMESFRNPNWTLLEDCTRWLASRLEPDAILSGNADTLEGRVALVSHALELFHSRANLKLNGKRLYGADGWAVRELLKVAMFLRTALASPQQELSDTSALSYEIGGRIGEIKQARSLATEITAQGAYLYDLLAKEAENKALREMALSRPLEMRSMEAALRGAVASAKAGVAEARERIDGVASSEAALDAKLERRAAELQRAEKRLHAVHKIKPAYQSELTALEQELEELWDRYVLRYRCVEALKQQLSLLERAHAEVAAEQQAAVMQLIQKYETEDVLGKLSPSDEEESSEGSSSSGGSGGSELVGLRRAAERGGRPAPRPRTRLRINTAGGGPGASSRRAFGAMGARDSLDDVRPNSGSDSPSALGRRVRGAGEGGGLRPGTRTLAAAEDFAEFGDGDEVIRDVGLESESSSDSELQRAAELTDDEF